MENDLHMPLHSTGFVTHWMVAGPTTRPFRVTKDGQAYQSQLEYERALREDIRCEPDFVPPRSVAQPGEPGPEGGTWSYYYDYDNYFIDRSYFYSRLTDVGMDAATMLESPAERTVQAVLWTYAAAGLYLNREKVAETAPPVYKPIRSVPVTLRLRRGLNRIYIRMRNLGVRDTLNVAGLQLREAADIQVALPGAAAPEYAMEQWLSSLALHGGTLAAEQAPTFRVEVSATGADWLPMTGRELALPSEWETAVVRCPDARGELCRRFELLERIHPVYRSRPMDPADYYREIAKTVSSFQDDDVYFSVFHSLARFALGEVRADEYDLLEKDLQHIRDRVDCADFLVVGMLRLLQKYPVSDQFRRDAKDALLQFRYWMDEDGTDGMCFWSENHALMFYGAQMVAGGLYPQESFIRSGLTGEQMRQRGEARCREWLDSVETYGFEEFMSGTYGVVTAAALLNLIDFGPADIAQRAARLMDRILLRSALHSFDGTVIAPQCRTYRDVIYPFRQGIQGVMDWIDPRAPYLTSRTLSFLDSTRYRFPGGLAEIIRQPAETSYTTGNARIVLKKTPDYLLTSVMSPRTDPDANLWKNTSLRHAAGKRSYDDASYDDASYNDVKSMNERFHGTTWFRPGVPGYQQHMWYAALSNECLVFVNHPGMPTDMTASRPGYWYGNGLFPALRQQGGRLGTVFSVPEDFPVRFTHVFWPTCRFDEVSVSAHWLFGRLRNGYVAIWCAGELTPAQNVLTDCEYRCMQDPCAYYCRCGSAGEDGDFARFMAGCRQDAPAFDAGNLTLSIGGSPYLRFERFRNDTQFV